MKFDLFNGGNDDENNDGSLVEISEIFAMQCELFSEPEPIISSCNKLPPHFSCNWQERAVR